MDKTTMARIVKTSGFPTTPDVSMIEETQYRVYDSLIATGLCFCLLIGLPGNCLAFSYFLKTKKRTLSTLLYIAASFIDIGSSIVHFPMTYNHFNQRSPGLLENKTFCSVWYLTILLLQQMSIFVVMILSICRAIVIMFPFYKVRKKAVIFSIFIYLVYQSAWNILKHGIYGEYTYSRPNGYCYFYTDNETLDTAYKINHAACLGIPPILVLAALILSILNLQGQKLTRTSQKNNRRSSLTIIYFTVIFLVCNTLTFVNNTLYIAVLLSAKSYPGPIYKNKFMFFYSWQLSEVFFTVLNASLNPILYMWRMKGMRLWVMGLIRKSDKSGSKTKSTIVSANWNTKSLNMTSIA